MALPFTSITLGPNDDGRRVDRIARKAFPHLPLARIYSAIRSGEIRINGRKVKGEARASEGDTLEIRAGLMQSAPGPGQRGRLPGKPVTPARSAPPDPDATARLEDRIVFRSPDIVVVNKARGELVHGKDSLAEVVIAYLADSERGGGTRSVSFTPGPLHRLDRNTSGLVMFSASLRGAQEVSRLLRDRAVRKTYVAVFHGVVDTAQTWKSRLDRDEDTLTSRSTDTTGRTGTGKEAVSRVTPISSTRGATLALVEIRTGRTHQIRAQAAEYGTPLLGDRKYGGPPFPGGYILHAAALDFLTGPGRGGGSERDRDATRPALPGGRLWTPLPRPAERRVRDMFGEDAVTALYERLSGQGRA